VVLWDTPTRRLGNAFVFGFSLAITHVIWRNSRAPDGRCFHQRTSRHASKGLEGRATDDSFEIRKEGGEMPLNSTLPQRQERAVVLHNQEYRPGRGNLALL
jgi:hypothetical protein